MQDRDVQVIIRSRKPRRGSGWAAIGSVAGMSLVSFLYWRNAWGNGPFLPAVAGKVWFGHEYWRLLTSMAAHTDLGHLLSNAAPLGVLAFLLYGYYGPRVYPLLTVPLGALVTGLALATYPAGAALVGASGLVYVMAAFWLTLYLFIERRYGVGKRLFRAVGFALLVLAPTTYDPDVSYRAHAIGVVVGWAAATVYFAWCKGAIRRAEVFEIERDEPDWTM